MADEQIQPTEEVIEPVAQKKKPVKKKTEVPPIKEKKSSTAAIIFGIIALIAIAVGAYFVWQNYQLKKNPNMASQAENKALIAKVGKLMELPQDDTPTVATVTDKEKIKEQAFFKDAENGDKVLIYVKGEKAILYRPTTNKIIGVTSVILEKPQGQNVPAGTQENPSENQQSSNGNEQPQNVKVSIYNGSKTAGVTLKVEDELKNGMENLDVITKSNAKKNDYEKTIVVDVSGNHQSDAEKMAKLLGGEVGQLPEGEETNGADVVVIAAQ
jgi:hypothetical protein